jgi:hypothetical protein
MSFTGQRPPPGFDMRILGEAIQSAVSAYMAAHPNIQPTRTINPTTGAVENNYNIDMSELLVNRPDLTRQLSQYTAQRRPPSSSSSEAAEEEERRFEDDEDYDY